MSLPETCWRCGAADWIGEQRVEPPTSFDAVVWSRRSTCKVCGAHHEELSGPYPLAILSRDQPIDWRGANPFEEA